MLKGIDHLEWWVGNARAFAGFLASSFGFRFVAHAGPETGRRDRVSYLLEQGDVRFLVTGALHPDSPVAEHVRQHGDGVRDIAFIVDDVDAALAAALARGATPQREARDDVDENGTIRHAAIATYGETVHTFLDRSGYHGPFAPQFEPSPVHEAAGPDVGIERIDHVVANVELGEMETWVKYYEDVFAMTELIHFSDEAISTEYSALMSKVVTSGDGRVKLPINEPAEGARKSQIDEYLEFYGGPGVQHIAVSTTDIVGCVEELAARGVKFLRTPESYYDGVPERIGEIDQSIDDLRRLGILVDRDDEGYLLQIFTKPLGDRPTIFFEIIERHGARGFGEGNFKALFEAIEREQELRGNL
jgi:4-hydroxyphenylpyruvate dioxygenase